MKRFCDEPWAARDKYIQVLLNRSQEKAESFFDEIKNRELSQEDRIVILKLLEIERHAMLMYTSCGWFFDDTGGIESV